MNRSTSNDDIRKLRRTLAMDCGHWRESHGFSQAGLARLSKLDTSTINRFESGEAMNMNTLMIYVLRGYRLPENLLEKGGLKLCETNMKD